MPDTPGKPTFVDKNTFTFEPIYMSRQQKVYPVSKAELNSLKLSTWVMAAGLALVGWFVPLYFAPDWDMQTATEIQIGNAVRLKQTYFILSALGTLVALVAWLSGRDIINEVRRYAGEKVINPFRHPRQWWNSL